MLKTRNTQYQHRFFKYNHSLFKYVIIYNISPNITTQEQKRAPQLRITTGYANQHLSFVIHVFKRQSNIIHLILFYIRFKSPPKKHTKPTKSNPRHYNISGSLSQVNQPHLGHLSSGPAPLNQKVEETGLPVHSGRDNETTPGSAGAGGFSWGMVPVWLMDSAWAFRLFGDEFR